MRSKCWSHTAHTNEGVEVTYPEDRWLTASSQIWLSMWTAILTLQLQELTTFLTDNYTNENSASNIYGLQKRYLWRFRGLFPSPEYNTLLQWNVIVTFNLLKWKQSKLELSISHKKAAPSEVSFLGYWQQYVIWYNVHGKYKLMENMRFPVPDIKKKNHYSIVKNKAELCGHGKV